MNNLSHQTPYPLSTVDFSTKEIEKIICESHNQHHEKIIEMAKRCISPNPNRSRSEYTLCLETIATYYNTLLSNIFFKVEGPYKIQSIEKSLQNANWKYQQVCSKGGLFSFRKKGDVTRAQTIQSCFQAIQYFEDKKIRLWSYLQSLEVLITNLYQKSVRLFQTTYTHIRQHLPIYNELELAIPKLNYVFSSHFIKVNRNPIFSHA